MSMEELTKAYNPKETESRIYKLWEESGYFNPDNLPERHKEPFSVALPPPNVTGQLHLGHALEHSLQDAVVRFQRMKGKKVLWLPGTDHAAIATETKVEKELIKNEDKTRRDLGREEFLKRAKEFAQKSHDTIISQIKTLGDSLDWSREAYTFDDQRNFAVRTAFKRMYDAGLIYRGHRVINWDPKGQTAVSDDEVEHEETKGTLYTFKYDKDFPIAIASTRPETKVGDTAVAVHPSDKRYAEYIGQEFDLEFAGAKLHIKIIADESVDPAYGTGALGVTPAHSIIDSEIAQRHQLPSIQVINEYGKMTEAAGSLVVGKKTKEAREIVAGWLKENGLLEKEEIITLNISKAQRSGGIIEPLPKLQWFVNVNKPIAERDNKTLKQLMHEPVADGRIKILPERFEKIYFHWIDNLRDWNISRQIWFGHQIPVWYRGDETYCGMDAPSGEGWVQDEDTLDTWFSSALWTFSTLGWPNETPDLKLYHPTSLMNPGYEILFFWVARMILMSQFLLGDIPFKTVYLHGILRDSKGQKFSKSLGNGVDPVEVIKEFGADALRMSVIVGIGPGNDGNFDINKVKGYKNFANKLWNIARYVLEKGDFSSTAPLMQNHVDVFQALVAEVTGDMDQYHFYLAAEKIYHYVWHTFADKIIEESKDKMDTYTPTMLYILKNSLKLLHPFMPFVTEELWSKLPHEEGKQMLIVETWPQ